MLKNPRYSCNSKVPHFESWCSIPSWKNKKKISFEENLQLKLRKNCPESEFFWSVFSRIQTEYRPQNSEYEHSWRSVSLKQHAQQMQHHQMII